MEDTHLVQVEVGGIQQFIFEGSRLREWRGASALLDKAERVDVKQALADAGLDPDRTVLRQGGGVVVVHVPEDTDPSAVQRVIERAYKQAAPGAQVYSAQAPLHDDVQRTLATLTFQVERNRGQALQVDADVSLLGPMARPCDSCGKRPAEETSEIGDDGRLLCGVCAHKGQHGGRVRRGEANESVLDRFRRYLHSVDHRTEVLPESLRKALPDDFNAIAEAGNGSLALIQADGNSLGKTVQKLTSLPQYEALSEGIAGAVERALFDTLAEYGPRKGVLPWEILFLGGDDILIATADDIALEVVSTLVKRIESTTKDVFDGEDLKALNRSHLSMGVGLVVSDAHIPISVLRDMAHALERSAKKRTYALQNEDPNAEVSTVDLHRITGSGSASLKHLRNYALQPRRAGGFNKVELTQRPFTLQEFDQVINVARTWKEAGLPNNKLHALREGLFISPAEAMRRWIHTVGRSSNKRHPAWLELNTLVSQTQGEEHPPYAIRSQENGEDEKSAATPLLDVLDTHALL